MTLTEFFSELPDPRTGPARRHDLTEMILMALCAVLCGADSWVDVAEWAEDNEAWLKRYLVLEHGTPSHDTFGRVFRLLDAKVFEACFREWVGSLVGAVAGVVAIDGKTACGSKDGHNTALHTITAFATASGLCLGQGAHAGQGQRNSRHQAGCAKTTHPTTSPPCASSPWPCCVRTPSIPSAASAPGEKPQSGFLSTALHSSASYPVGKCDCPARRRVCSVADLAVVYTPALR